MNDTRQELISFYWQWIEKLEIDGRVMAACMISEEGRREVLEIYRRRTTFLRKCIAHECIKLAA